MNISRFTALDVAKKIVDGYHTTRDKNGTTDRDKLAKLITARTGRKIRGEASLNKIEAALSTL